MKFIFEAEWNLMQISQQTDYAMRILIFLGTMPASQGPWPARHIADVYQIQLSHLNKAIQALADKGYVRASAGRNGGISLNVHPWELSLGDVMRCTEPEWNQSDCLRGCEDTCILATICQVKKEFLKSMGVFLERLDQVTLEDVLINRKELSDVFWDRLEANGHVTLV